MKADVYIVTQGRTLLMPDWPEPPTIPDWLRDVLRAMESETVARLRELGCV